jgi:predicted amidohydrolase YtcJ
VRTRFRAGLPGLHDYHVHLRALAAAAASVSFGPPRTRTAAELAARLRAADADLPGPWALMGLLPVNALLVPLALAAGGA